jgi:hypothetical protein
LERPSLIQVTLRIQESWEFTKSRKKVAEPLS